MRGQRRLTGALLRAAYDLRALRYRAEVAMPRGTPSVSVAGPDPVRVLLLGGGIAVGYGAPTHDESLTGALARLLAERSGRGAAVAATADQLADLRRIGERLVRTGVPHQRADDPTRGVDAATTTTAATAAD